MIQKSENQFLIIGAGPVGLAMAKSLKANHLPYCQVEATDDVGGNWYHGVYKSANILSSRKATEYPDYPMPADYPDFPSSEQMHQYYKLYAQHYHLFENIRFNKKVVSVNPTNDSRWLVKFEDGEENIYKGVIVCNGHHWSRDFPTIDGVFSGESFHSKDYKVPDQLRNKRVLVIGSGNSAFDISSECARVSKKCFLSIRKGIWVFPKTFMGKPLSHFQSATLPLPYWLKMKMAKIMIRLAVGSYKDYGFPKPTIGIDQRHPTINTDTLLNIRNGRISVKGAVKKFSGYTVEFENGSSEEVDTIVYATGFKVDFPFLPKSLNRVENKVVKTYGWSMFDDFKGLYIIGWFQPRGGVGSLIAPYADLMAKFIGIQEKISAPLGAVLNEMGERLPEVQFIGGPEFLGWVRKKERQLSKIERRGLKLEAKYSNFQNPVLKTDKVMTSLEPLNITA